MKKLDIFATIIRIELMNPIDTLCAPKQRDSYDVNPEAYSERCQKSKMVLFAKISFHKKVYIIASCYSIVMGVILLNDVLISYSHSSSYHQFFPLLLKLPQLCVIDISGISELSNSGVIGKKISKSFLIPA